MQPTALDLETAPFWDAVRDGSLLIKRCNTCGVAHFYPRPFCPKCWSDDVHFEAASGRATLYTFSIVRVNDLPPFDQRVPYVAAIVDLDEGPRMMTNVVACPPNDVRIGMRLEVEFQVLDDETTIPVFRPSEPR